MSYVSSSKMNAIATTIKGELDKKTPLTTVAPAYDSATVYKSGVLLTYNQKLYKCIKDATAGTLPTNTTYFKEVTVKEELDGKITFGSDWFDGSGSVHYAEEAGLAEGIATDRTIDNPEDSCPAITFGTVGGEAEIQTGINKFQTLFGNSFKYNQLARLANSGTISESGITITFNGDGSITVNGTATANIYRVVTNQDFTVINGHNYYLGTGYQYLYYTQLQNAGYERGGKITTATTTSNACNAGIFIPNGTTLTNKRIYVKVIDLTAMGINASTVDEAIAALKAIGIDVNQYLPYNESAILSSKSASLISRGFNQWDEEWEVGEIQDTTGQNVSSSTVIRSKNYIKVIPNITYYFKTPKVMTVYQYDINKNFLGQSVNFYANNSAQILDSRCEFIRFKLSSAYGTTYNHDICINLNQWGDTIDTSRNGEYVPYRSQTVTLPNIELRSVGDVKDEAYSVGGGKRRVGRIDLGTLNWIPVNNSETARAQGLFLVYGLSINIKNYKDSSLVIPNIMSIKYTSIANYYLQASNRTDKTEVISTAGGSILYIKSASFVDKTDGEVKTLLSGVYLYYELATETDIPESENPGWTENVYTDNYGTLEFTTDPVQNPQVPQPYFIEYTISLTEWVDSAYTRTSGDANTIATEDELDAIRGGNDVVGKAKLADNLESNNKTALLSAYVFGLSPTGKADSMLMDKIVGGDVAWNQIFDKVVPTSTSAGVTFTKVDDTQGTASGGTSSSYCSMNIAYGQTIYTPYNHIFLYWGMEANSQSIGIILNGYTAGGVWKQTIGSAQQGNPKVCKNNNSEVEKVTVELLVPANTTLSKTYTVKPQIIDLTQMFGSAIANYIYSLEQATPGAGVNKIRLLFPKSYYPYNAGELLPVRTVGRKAVGINAWDEEWELGGLSTTTGASYSTSNSIISSNFIRVVKGQTYYCKAPNNVYVFMYDANQNFIDYIATNKQNQTFDFSGNGGNGNSLSNTAYIKFRCDVTSYNHDICINISDPSINGTFYPYVENTYPVDDVKLHGVFYLDSGNNIVTKGDEYTPDGKVLRKFRIVDMGTLNYSTITRDNKTIMVIAPDLDNIASNGSYKSDGLLCSKYQISSLRDLANIEDKTILQNSTSVFIYDSAYTSTAAFKTAMSGVYLVYELATPTEDEETHSAYASTQVKGTTQQWLEPEWTEEETPIMVPVGNQATLFDDLKKKVEIAADMPADDGTYVLNKSGGSNTYTPLETWLGNNGYNKMQVLSEAFGAKEALGGTLRQLLAVKESLDFDETLVVDLGDLNWVYISSDTAFRASITTPKQGAEGSSPKILCTKYKKVNRSYIGGLSALGDKVINLGVNNFMVQIRDTTYTDATAFKAAMKGVLLAYEKASS